METPEAEDTAQINGPYMVISAKLVPAAKVFPSVQEVGSPNGRLSYDLSPHFPLEDVQMLWLYHDDHQRFKFGLIQGLLLESVDGSETYRRIGTFFGCRFDTSVSKWATEKIL